MWEAILVLFFIISAIYRAIKNAKTKSAANTPDSAEVQRRRQEAYERAQREYAARAAQQGQGVPGQTAASGMTAMPGRAPAVMTASAKQAASSTPPARASLPARATAPARAPLPGATRGQSAATVAPKQSARPPQIAQRRTIDAPASSTPLDSSGDESFRRNVRDLEASEARALNIPLTDTPDPSSPPNGLAGLQQRLALNNPQTAPILSALILAQVLDARHTRGRHGNTNSPLHPLS